MKHRCSSQPCWCKWRAAWLKISKYSQGPRKPAKEERPCTAENQDKRTQQSPYPLPGISWHCCKSASGLHGFPPDLTVAHKALKGLLTQYLLWSPCRQEEPEVFLLVSLPFIKPWIWNSAKDAAQMWLEFRQVTWSDDFPPTRLQMIDVLCMKIVPGTDGVGVEGVSW